MANPNIVNVGNIFGKTNLIDLTNTSAFVAVTNPSNSNKVLKLNSLILSNIDIANTIQASASVYAAANIGGAATQIITTTIPANSSLVVIDKATSIYIEENRSVGVTANTASVIKAIVSFEEIS